MDVTTLGFFKEIAEVSSFSTVAAEQNISQSSLSKAIIRLENELGVQLFNRQHHPITLTAAGQCLYDDLVKMEPLYRSAMQRVHAFSSSKYISIIVVPSLSIMDIRHHLNKFSNANPDYTFFISNKGDFLDIVPFLQSGEPDFVITHKPLENYPKYKSTFLHDDDLYLLMPKSHPLAGRSSVQLSDLSNETVYVNEFSKTILRDLSAEYGFAPKKIIHKVGESCAEAISSVPYRDGVSIFYDSDIRIYRLTDIVIARIDGTASRPLVLLENSEKELKDYHKEFRRFMIKSLSK